MNATQVQFFGEFQNYTIDNNVSALENFKRLSGQRFWKVGAPAWNGAWQRCFGRPYDVSQYPFHAEVLRSYFDRFPKYYTNTRLTMAQEFAHLASSQGWAKNSMIWKREWREYLLKSFAQHHGADSRLEGWQKLCTEVGKVPGRSITQCKTILKSVYVNLVDLMNCRRSWNNAHGRDDPIPEDGLPGLVKFINYSTFLLYTQSKGKVFPKATAKADGFVKALLREVFHHH
ncbi:uncharacterized protein IWZ02DRAFT_492742 [Phyllosticta citriasiana]|uniref:uncharacterized protein n=1 Tax=Phyllosticta citriasiana TaxID=595635 RepID=UPI0030FDADFD